MAAELSEVISRLREDLAAAMLDGRDERLRFELGPIEVTLSVTITSEGGGKAGVKFWVVEAGVDGRRSSATGQQIKLILNPVDAAAPPRADGTASRALVTGAAVAGEAD